MRNRKQKVEQKSLTILSAKYIHDFTIGISFSTGEKKLVDFLPLFHKYVKGDHLKYFTPQNFKKFIVSNGNIYWGKKEDVIFPVALLLKIDQRSEVEETLYII